MVLILQTPHPVNPRNLQYKNLTKNSATLYWDGGSGDVIVNDQEWISNRSSPYVLDSLSFDTEYNVKIKNAGGESNQITFKTLEDILVVDINGTGDYTSVVEAAKKARNGATIKVKPGIYLGTVESQGKNITIVGTDRDTCILKSTDGRYDYPAINFGSGKLENLTIVAEYVNGESNEIDSNTTGAYAIHADDPASANKKTEINNCNIRSDFFPAIGCGLRQNYTIDIVSSTLVNNQDGGRGGYINQGTLGAVFVHDVAADNVTNQKINITDCTLKSNKANALCIHDLGRTNSKAAIFALNNTLTSSSSTSSVWFRGKDAWTNSWSLDVGSKGNSDNVLNK